MEKKTHFKEAKVYVAANGFTVYFRDYIGEPTVYDFYVAKTLDEVKTLLKDNLIPFSPLITNKE